MLRSRSASRSSSGRIRVAVAALAAVAVAMSACSNSGDDELSSAGSQQDPRNGADAGGHPAPGTPEYELLSSYGLFADFLEAGSPSAICAKLTPAFQRRLAGAAECEDRMLTLFARGAPTTARRRVVDVKLEGDRAVATVRVRHRAPHTVRLVRKDDTWLVDGGGAGLFR